MSATLSGSKCCREGLLGRILLLEARLSDLRLDSALHSDDARKVGSVETLTGSLNLFEDEAPVFEVAEEGDDADDMLETGDQEYRLEALLDILSDLDGLVVF